jgi:TrmH family RNA methyltransferase
MKFDDLKKLHQKTYRQELGYFLVEGEHPVLELQKAVSRSPALRSSELYVTKEHAHWRGPFETHVITAAQMSQLTDTRTPQGIVALVPVLPPPEPRQGERALYLYEIQDPGNLGTFLRTLAWFGNFRCLLSPNSVDPYNSKVVRATAGALFHVPMEMEVDLQTLGERFGQIASLDMTGEPVASPDFRAFNCYLFGNEARGLPRDQLAGLNVRSFTIAGHGSLESLNLASAVNMCLYELNR